MSDSLRCLSSRFVYTLIPPLSRFINFIYGTRLFNLIPKPSNSYSIFRFIARDLVASRTISNKSEVLAVAITYLPLPLLSLAPSMIPGRSTSYIFVSLYNMVPGMAVSVVNSHAATALFAEVSFVRIDDLPTDGKPTRPTRA